MASCPEAGESGDMTPIRIPFDHSNIEERFHAVAADRRRKAVKIFGLTFAPLHGNRCSDLDDDSSSRYLLGCSSSGKISFWDLSVDKRKGQALAVLDVTTEQGHRSGGPLYNVSFIQKKPAHDFLVVAIRGGVLLYKWSEIQAKLDAIVDASSTSLSMSTCSSLQPATFHDVHPITTLSVHPNPDPRRFARIHNVSFDVAHGVLYGAADDGFGSYAWDIERQRVLGTLGRSITSVSSSNSTLGHAAVCNIDGEGKVLTGGNVGEIEVWDARQLSLIESIDISSCFRKGASDKVISDNGNLLRNNMSCFSISSLDVASSGDWVAIGGSARENNRYQGGFVSIFHLPSRTLANACMTSESIHDIKYVNSFQSIVTAGNEGVISFWSNSDLLTGRSSRAWISTPNAHCVAVDNDALGLSNDYLVAVGGTGTMVDCFSHGNKAHTLYFA